MALIRSGRRGFWLAQYFVAVILALIGFRFLGSLGQESEIQGVRAGTRGSPLASSERVPRPDRSGLLPGRGAPRPETIPAPAGPLSSPGPDRASPKGAPYTPQEDRTWLSRDEESYRVWDLDPRELAWLLANKRQILKSDLDTRPEPGGGLRVLRIRDGSFGSYRGFRVGDLLRNINGQALDDSFDLEDLIEDPAHSGARGWRVVLEREGRPLTLDYRPAPGQITSVRNH